MNQDLHERALSAAYKKLPYSPGLHHVEPAIAEYLRVAGLTVVPVEADVKLIGEWYRYKNGHNFADEPLPRDTSDVGAWRAMLAAFKSPFDEVA